MMADKKKLSSIKRLRKLAKPAADVNREQAHAINKKSLSGGEAEEDNPRPNNFRDQLKVEERTSSFSSLIIKETCRVPYFKVWWSWLGWRSEMIDQKDKKNIRLWRSYVITVDTREPQ